MLVERWVFQDVFQSWKHSVTQQLLHNTGFNFLPLRFELISYGYDYCSTCGGPFDLRGFKAPRKEASCRRPSGGCSSICQTQQGSVPTRCLSEPTRFQGHTLRATEVLWARGHLDRICFGWIGPEENLLWAPAGLEPREESLPGVYTRRAWLPLLTHTGQRLKLSSTP